MSRVDRRGFLRVSGQALVGLTGVPGRAPASSHLYGWPAPPDERTQLVTNTSIIPNMFARVVTNAAKPRDAIVWAETEIKRIVDKK
jgi:hypothetical protein